MRHPTSTFRLAILLITFGTFLILPVFVRAQTDSIEAIEHRKISLKVEKADIQDILRDLFKSVKANYVIDEAIKGKLSVAFEQVPFRVALETVLSLAPEPLTYKFNNAIYSVSLKGKEERNSPGLGPDFVGRNDSGSRIQKIHSSSLNTSASAIIKRIKEEATFFDLKDLLPKAWMNFSPDDIALIASPPDNSILIRVPDSPEGEVAFRELQQRIKLMDYAPREVDLRVEVILVRGGKREKAQMTVMEVKGHTTTEHTVTMQTTVQRQSLTKSDILLSTGNCKVTVKPTVNGDESIQLEAEANLDLTFKLPEEGNPLHFSGNFNGAGRYLSGRAMLLGSNTLRSQNGQSRADTIELLILVTPVLPKWIPPLPSERSPQDAPPDPNK